MQSHQQQKATLLRKMAQNDNKIMLLTLLIMGIEGLAVWAGCPRWATLSLFGLLVFAEACSLLS